MQKVPRKRADLKQASLRRILDAGARRLRSEGLDGAAIAPVMQDAGLTHGAFYSHFSSKDDLAVAAFAHAIAEGRPRWTAASGEPSWGQRLKRLAGHYLSHTHRDDRAAGCAFAALSADAARAAPRFREAYETELRGTLDSIRAPFAAQGGERQKTDDAIALMALCVGGIALARAVGDAEFSDRILRACQEAAAVLGGAADLGNPKTTTQRGEK